MKVLRILSGLIAAASLGVVSANAFAQGAAGYPNRTVRLIVPFAAGGGTDLMARNIAQKLNEAWKQPVLVENRTGAGGMIGADAAAKSPGDGYTYLVASTTTAINATLVTKPPYDMQRDLQSVAILGTYSLVGVVPAASPYRSLQDIVIASRSKTLNAGSGGTGTPLHLVLEMFKAASGAKIQHVPYKGGGPALVDLMGGQVDLLFSLSAECLPQVKAGKVRALAVTTESRFSLMPDVPTTAEAGFPSVQATGWNGLMVPSGTPKEIIAKINAEVTNIMSAPDMKARIVEQGFTPIAMNVADTEKFVAADVERWGKVIRDANIKAD